ncbi:MAG: SH3 domain-containing protein [Actinomycetota bacterium]
MSSGFQPTHLVPKGGTRAWAAADASADPIASLHAKTELQVLERDGAWARVQAENGWEGWVDGRVLVPVEARAAAEPAQSGGWAPTHQVGYQGVSAWADPDPSTDPVAQLQPRIQLQVLEEQGAWARVTGENGWTGWVDGRALQALAAGGPSIPTGVLPLVGVALILVGSFLPLMSWGGSPINAWQIPLLSWLFNSAAGSWLPTGIFLLVTLGVAVPLATGRSLSARVLFALGAVAVDVVIITLVRAGAEDLTSPGVGLFVIFAGGLLVMAESVRRRRSGASA